eukprot:sb/3472421/
MATLAVPASGTQNPDDLYIAQTYTKMSFSNSYPTMPLCKAKRHPGGCLRHSPGQGKNALINGSHPLGAPYIRGVHKPPGFAGWPSLFPHLMVAMATKSETMRHVSTELLLMRNVTLTVVLMRSSLSRRYRLTNDFDDASTRMPFCFAKRHSRVRIRKRHFGILVNV